jgi:hypothetical protein
VGWRQQGLARLQQEEEEELVLPDLGRRVVPSDLLEERRRCLASSSDCRRAATLCVCVCVCV